MSRSDSGLSFASFEALETRRLMADFSSGANVYVSGGTLYAHGTDLADHILVESVVRGGAKQHHVKIMDASGRVRRDLGGTPLDRYFSSVFITAVDVQAKGGDDSIDTSAYVGDASVFAGEGNDLVRCGNGNDRAEGDVGDDSLDGGAGDDFLIGGLDDDSLSGGRGRDTMWGWTHYNLKAGQGFDRFRDEFDPTAPVLDGTDILDVRQGTASTCKILSTLGAAAYQGIDLAGRIAYLGGNQYAVRLLNKGNWTWETVAFDGTWSSHDAQPTQEHVGDKYKPEGAFTGEFWALLYQRAYLQMQGFNPTDPELDYQLDYVEGLNAAHVVTSITGRTANRIDRLADGTYPDAAPEALAAALDRGEVIIANAEGHLFAVLEVFKDSTGNWRLKIYNPRAFDGSPITNAYVWTPGEGAHNEGVMTQSWEEFVDAFDYLCRTSSSKLQYPL